MREQPNNNERYFIDSGWKVVDKGGKFKKGNEKEILFKKSNSEVYEYENTLSFNSSKEINKPRKQENNNDRETTNKPYNQLTQHSDRYHKNKSYKKYSHENENENLDDNNYDCEYNQNQNKNEINEMEFEKKYYENDYDHSQKSSRSNNYKTERNFKSNAISDKFNIESNQNFKYHNKNYNQKSFNYYQKNDSFSNKGKNYDSNQKNYYVNTKVYEERNQKNNFSQEHNETNDRFQETNEDYYEIRETSLNENSRESNIKRQENKINNNSNIEETKYLSKETYMKTKKSYFMKQNKYNESNNEIYTNKRFEKRGSNKNKYQNGDYFDVAFSLDKSKNQNYEILNSKNSLEKQYNETNINILFEQVIPTNEVVVPDKIENDAGSLNSTELKDIQAEKEKAPQKFLQPDDHNKKVTEKSEVKRPSYKMEVEKISLSITNISINENKEEDKNQEVVIKKDSQKINFINQENEINTQIKSKINPDFKEDDCSKKVENVNGNINECYLENKNSDKDCKTENLVEEQLTNYEFFKQLPKNSFINAINYNNYFFGNNNPRDMKKEDFEKSNLQNNFGFGMTMNIPNPYHRIPHPNYKPLSTPPTTPFIPMPFYSGNPDYSSQNHYPHQMIGLYPSQYMIPYPFMESYVPMPNYQNSYPYLNQNGQLLYSNYGNNINNSESKSHADGSINPDVSKQ